MDPFNCRGQRLLCPTGSIFVYIKQVRLKFRSHKVVVFQTHHSALLQFKKDNSNILNNVTRYIALTCPMRGI